LGVHIAQQLGHCGWILQISRDPSFGEVIGYRHSAPSGSAPRANTKAMSVVPWYLLCATLENLAEGRDVFVAAPAGDRLQRDPRRLQQRLGAFAPRLLDIGRGRIARHLPKSARQASLAGAAMCHLRRTCIRTK
jgi:hypothetical protein